MDLVEDRFDFLLLNRRMNEYETNELKFRDTSRESGDSLFQLPGEMGVCLTPDKCEGTIFPCKCLGRK